MKDKTAVTSLDQLTVGDLVYWESIDSNPFFELDAGTGLVVHKEPAVRADERTVWIVPMDPEQQLEIKEGFGSEYPNEPLMGLCLIISEFEFQEETAASLFI